jgi:sulfur carrier protein
VTIWLNGEQAGLQPGANVAQAVAAAGAPSDGRGVAAAVDGEIVPRDRWQEIELADGQRVEVVQAVQGG